MIQARAVIGSGYGDEGKGATVDALVASTPNCLVIRHNGGAQAGHTVVTPEGVRHVFSHFGSGALAGAPTFLSRYFVVNPRIFLNEWAELKTIWNANLDVTIDPAAQITTPYDVLINRWAEEARGDSRHGSVGIGFGETIERAQCGNSFTMAQTCGISLTTLETYMKRFRSYSHARLVGLGIKVTDEMNQTLHSPELVILFFDKLCEMQKRVELGTLQRAAKGRNLIFEGAQGLLLDQQYGNEFPYVTRSNTGLTNVVKLCKELSIYKVKVYYCTRTYTTRHGAGPLDNEYKNNEFAVEDLTNTEKPWQGKLRFAPLSVERIKAAMLFDSSNAGRSMTVLPGLVISHLDQAPFLPLELRKHFPLPLFGTSVGPKRSDRELY